MMMTNKFKPQKMQMNAKVLKMVILKFPYQHSPTKPLINLKASRHSEFLMKIRLGTLK